MPWHNLTDFDIMSVNVLTQLNSSLDSAYALTMPFRIHRESIYVDLQPPTKLKQLPTAYEFGQTPNSNDQDYIVAKTQTQEKPFVAPLIKFPQFEAIDASPMQIWEGKVLEVDRDKGEMQVFLNATMHQVLPHTGKIELQWVSEQDMELVCPGAIFYLTLFKRIKRGGNENAQELRFRRLPSWTKQQLAQVEREANMLLSKMKARPISE